MIVEGGETTEKNPTSKMVTGPVLNVKIITSLGERIAIAAMRPRAMREAIVVHVVIIEVATEEAVDSVETIAVATEVAEIAGTIVVETGVEAAVDTEVAEIAGTIVVETDVEAAVEIAGTIVVVAEEMEVSAEMTEAEDARVIVNNDRVMTGHRAENTKVAMIANQSDGTQEDPAGGVRKARVETVGAEISRGVFI